MSKYGSASAIICWGEKILLFHRDDIPTIPFPDYWSLPGGGTEEGETPLETIQRELFEEVTYVPAKLELLHTLTGKSGLSTSLYVAFVSDDEAPLFVHKSEEGQEIAFFTLNEMKDLKLAPKIKEQFTALHPIISEMLISKDISTLQKILNSNQI